MKGSRVRRSFNSLSLPAHTHVAFFSYRWLAWLVAALVLTLPSHPLEQLPRDVVLLLLIGVLNLAATALAQAFTRLARQRPVLLLLDLLAGTVMLWLSGSQPLPFMPYALSGLVLPALLFGWWGALGATMLFSLLDLLGLLLINPEAGVDLVGSALVLRVLAPPVFAGLWVVAGYLLNNLANARARQTSRQGPKPTASSSQNPPGLARPSQPLRVLRPTPPQPGPVNRVLPGPLVLTPAVPQPQVDPARRLLSELTLNHTIGLVAALTRIGVAVRDPDSLEVRVHATGVPRPLAPAHYALLLRIAHEALCNIQQHAHAHTALLSLTYEHDLVMLQVQDDGVGLLDGTYERPGMHALRAIRYRIAELEGHLEIVEPESGGLTLRAILPYA